jgi:5-methylcytosine-specific restriction endonuclease McrA
VNRSTRAEASRNERGSAEARRRRREWLLATYRANVDLYIAGTRNSVALDGSVRLGTGEPACRCYRCGELLTLLTLTVDRIVAGCHGGTYRRNNIRPACFDCNNETGQRVRSTERRNR